MEDGSHQRETGLDERLELFRALRLVGTVGLTIVGTVMGCFLLGLAASRQFSLGPVPIVAGVLVGVVLSFVWVYRMLVPHVEQKARSQSDDDAV